MKLFRSFAAAVLTAAFFAGPALAQERGTKEEAKAMVEAAIEHIRKVGPEKAYKDFNTDKAVWAKKDLYVVAFDSKGTTLAHGANEKLIGKDLSALKDGNGVPILPGLMAAAAKGGGWHDYDWPDPLTKKLAPKSTYAKKLPSGDGFVGVGVYR
jgi:signal transduction histidine kinase